MATHRPPGDRPAAHPLRTPRGPDTPVGRSQSPRDDEGPGPEGWPAWTDAHRYAITRPIPAAAARSRPEGRR